MGNKEGIWRPLKPARLNRIVGPDLKGGLNMQRKLISRISMIAAPVMIVCGLLASGVPARAQSGDDGPCSNQTLRGDYGFAVEGVILPGPGVAIPVRGVHMTHFDGNGNLTQVDSILLNGGPISDWTPVTGTYHLNANCTGTILLHPSTGGFVNLRIVVVRRGKEIHAVVWPPFDGPNRTVASVGIRVE
jgi:hypothetical protein